MSATLDLYFLPRGPCAFCGHKDARHRIFDAIIDLYEHGAESIESLAYDYNVPIEAINLVITERPYKRRKHVG